MLLSDPPLPLALPPLPLALPPLPLALLPAEPPPLPPEVPTWLPPEPGPSTGTSLPAHATKVAHAALTARRPEKLKLMCLDLLIFPLPWPLKRIQNLLVSM